MGSKRTTYAHARRAPTRPSPAWCSRAMSRSRTWPPARVRPLGQLTSASWKGGALQQFGAPITEAELANTARSTPGQRRREPARATRRSRNPAALQRELETRHLAVLKAPQDRGRPHRSGGAAGARSPQRAGALSADRRRAARLPPASEHAAAIAATRWVIYKQDRRESGRRPRGREASHARPGTLQAAPGDRSREPQFRTGAAQAALTAVPHRRSSPPARPR